MVFKRKFTQKIQFSSFNESLISTLHLLKHSWSIWNIPLHFKSFTLWYNSLCSDFFPLFSIFIKLTPKLFIAARSILQSSIKSETESFDWKVIYCVPQYHLLESSQWKHCNYFSFARCIDKYCFYSCFCVRMLDLGISMKDWREMRKIGGGWWSFIW